jgi:hypothetical protein
MSNDTDQSIVIDYVPLPAANTALSRPAKVRPVILAWALGIPIPLILLVLLIRGCM